MAVELYSLLCFAEMELGLDLPCVLLLQHQLLPAHHHTLDQCATQHHLARSLIYGRS